MAYITINRKHFENNIDVVKRHLESIEPSREIEIAAVLKDNAYGHGLEIMAELASSYGIKTAFVKNYDEALRIKDKFDCITFFYGDMREKFSHIYPSIHHLSDIDRFEKSLGNLSDLGVELKVNVGMNRNGITPSDLESVIEKIMKNNMRLIGVFAHNGYGDGEDAEFYAEIERFEDIKGRVVKLSNTLGFPMPRFHALNSSSTFRVKTCSDSLVRIGIALYGYLACDIQSASNLKPVLKLYANKVSSRILKKGDRVGYDGVSQMNDEVIVSTYDIGYGDGLCRLNGDRKLFLPNGNEIIAKNSMDCFSSYGELDEICVIDDANYVAGIFDTIPHEVLVRLSPFIKRIVV